MEIGYYQCKKLADANGSVNRMTKQEIYLKLQKAGLDTSGSKDVLKKRLKVHLKKKHLGSLAEKSPFKYFCVIDFEATCEAGVQNYVHEIIEFPAILVNAAGDIVDEFHSYCKPSLNYELTDFCKELTGITQEQVKNAKSFAEVFLEFEGWLAHHNLLNEARDLDKYSFALVTDGPWDICRFLATQTELSEIKFPSYAYRWINLRKAFVNYYQPKGKINLDCMLQCLGMTFEGRQHCGLHDSRNIARILQKLVQDEATLKYNEKITGKITIDKDPSKKKRYKSVSALNPETQNPHENLGVDPDFVGQEHILLLTKGLSSLHS